MEEISRAVEDALAYRIAKTVRIRDKWLYGYSIAATMLVLFYIVILKIGVDKVQDWHVGVACPPRFFKQPHFAHEEHLSSGPKSERRTGHSMFFDHGLTAASENGTGSVLVFRVARPSM